MKHIKKYESFNDEIKAGDYLTCIFSDHEGFEYGKQYKVKEVSASKLTVAVYNNNDKRIFFHNFDGEIERRWTDDIDQLKEEKVILFNGTLEEYKMSKDANNYNL